MLIDFTVDKPTKTVSITAEFEAGLDLVWDAYTRAELLDKWWAPKPYSSRTKVMDFEVGGRRFYAMVSPEATSVGYYRNLLRSLRNRISSSLTPLRTKMKTPNCRVLIGI